MGQIGVLATLCVLYPIIATFRFFIFKRKESYLYYFADIRTNIFLASFVLGIILTLFFNE